MLAHQWREWGWGSKEKGTSLGRVLINGVFNSWTKISGFVFVCFSVFWQSVPSCQNYMPVTNCLQGVSSGQHAKTMPVMKHLVFQSMSLVAAIMPVINGLVFENVHEWSCVSEGA